MAESARYKPAGKYELSKFELSTIVDDARAQAGVFGEAANDPTAISDGKTDIKALVHVWDITESIQKGYVSGSARVYDAIGVYYAFPIRGQEKLTIVYKDWHGVEREEELFVYSVTDIEHPKDSDDSMLAYTLHFCSWGKFWSERYSVSRCIADGARGNRRYVTVDKQVEVLYEDYYIDEGQGTKKDLILHETDGPQKIVIPNMRPESAMHLMSRKAYDTTYASNYFRFFENRDKYNFINLERLSDATPKETFKYVSGPVDQTPSGEFDRMKQIISLSMSSPVDTFEALKSGAYHRRLGEVDITNRRVINDDYDHEAEFIEYFYPGTASGEFATNLKHTPDMISEHLNDQHLTYVIKDYPDREMNDAYGVRPKPHYGEIYNMKRSHAYDYKQSRYTIKIYGNNNIFAGDLIKLEFPYFTIWDKNEIAVDLERSGTFLVESITNEFAEATYVQTLVVSRGPLADRN
jgi:hypothetical protein